ncbi:beta-ketoacyl synthase N-terminal-like domain-containing protein [Flagellimonas meishanensis]|uniref:beta-ketoacyl synthase N-terminal-like domain-containing protein n=1 Tax=Flagellimonas meishanensis TaxID=2873264 RepID=UPI001CA693E9|nr:beta-ketoacyl synthase N-terminal-like domain-containing protein [[Muricauda] meishanensis]
MLKTSISITALSSISSLGSSSEEVWDSYLDGKHHLSQTHIGDHKVWVSRLQDGIRSSIQELRSPGSNYRNLDDTVLFALYTARKALQQTGWGTGSNFGINMGSSRGATHLFERHHEAYLNNGTTSTLTSPTTTLGNISSWVAHDLKTKGPVISHSITCSTALHAMLNAIAWIQGGLSEKFMVGGSEAPLTPFTVAQMQALKIYSKDSGAYPCRALDLKKKLNTMVLGEGAAIACLEKGEIPNALALIQGIGYATEPLEHEVSISSEAQCFQDSMKMALGNSSLEEVDAVVMHAPGTVKGDLSEYKAIEKVFNGKLPYLTTNKWKVGHTFGASGLLSVEMAVLMLRHQRGIPVPFFPNPESKKEFNKILVNAVGFGGNAVSILLARPKG